ncbi:hypothetical protein [Cellulophaga baltica]|uniref:hypothetical protein n=1 Tax=Cellulophaga baltica TaxID=76594 RepID=UPI0015F4559C|nr:hypothetical protein [Cellulophaga baltica]MBA6316878.1 hypothetical protein [Cellulophaga baltica]
MDIGITILKGGSREFEKTGVYPRYILFYSSELKRNWRFKLLGEEQSGVLKINKEPAFKYEFSENSGCRIQAIGENEWHYVVSIRTEMRD